MQSHRELSIVVDGCSFAGSIVGVTPLWRESMVDAICFTIPGAQAGPQEALSAMGHIWRCGFEQAESLVIATRATDLITAKESGKKALIMATQHAELFAQDLNLLVAFRQLGLRMVQITYNTANYFGYGCAEVMDCGLTKLGRRLVSEANRFGMVLDLSHCGPRTTLDAIETSEMPVVFSHANPRSICDNPRNKTDEAIKMLAEKGGVMGITPWGPVCWKGAAKSRPSLEDYLDHIDYVVDLVGIDHVGFASDGTIDGTSDIEGTLEQAARYPEIVGSYDKMVGQDPEVRYAEGVGNISRLPAVVEGLRRRGYSPQDIGKFLGGNFMRVFSQVWRDES